MNEYDLENTDGIPADLRQELDAKVRSYYSQRNNDTNNYDANSQRPLGSGQRSLEREHTPQPWSYYERMKKDNKWAYIPHDVEKQMLADYKTLGERFEDGDFNQ